METAQEVKDKNENIGSKGLLTDEEGVKSEETLQTLYLVQFAYDIDMTEVQKGFLAFII